MPKQLPERPNLDQLKKQAKDLLKSKQSNDPSAIERFRANHPKWANRSVTELQNVKVSLSDAQLVIAREYGFPTWPRLKEHVEALPSDSDPLESLKAAILADDVRETLRILERHPELKPKLNDPLPDFCFGSTPLIAAVQRKNKKMIDLLVRAGADINGRSHWWAGGFGVLDDDHGLAQFLIDRGAVVDVHAAARLGMLDRLKELIKAFPALLHSRGGDGQTPLHFAKSTEIASFLVEQGADIDARDVDHESTPAQYMIRDRQPVARYLVQQGCHTDILMAAALGDLELVRKHLTADPDCIHMNVSHRFFPKRDHRAGGHIYTWTLGQYKTPHSIAREFGHEDVFQFLLERSPVALKLAQACELGDEKLFRELLSAHPTFVHELSDKDRRKVAEAAQNNNTQAVRLMLLAGWPVDARSQHGATPLHWAAFHGNAEMTRIILSHNPPLESLDDDFHGTPVGWATHGSEHEWHCKTGNYLETVEALVKAGARVPEKIQGTDEVKEFLRGRAGERSVI